MHSERQLIFIVPGDINIRTGGYRYDKRVIEGLRARGWLVTLLSLDGNFPFPDEEQLSAAGNMLAQLEDASLVVVDGLAYSVMPELLAEHAHRLKLIALIHHPLALETDLSPSQADKLRQLESTALVHAQHVITTSETTALSLSEYHVPAARITPVRPGTDAAPISYGSQGTGLNLLCVATLTHRKGHTILLDALKMLEKKSWHLYCAGSLTRDQITSDRLIEQRTTLGLNDRVTFLGELDEEELAKQYRQADLFVLSSFYEGYGMVLDEAISYALPIITSNAGAAGQTLPKGAGLLVPPGNSQALANTLGSFMDNNAGLRDGLRMNALKARSARRSWELATQEFEMVLNRN